MKRLAYKRLSLQRKSNNAARRGTRAARGRFPFGTSSKPLFIRASRFAAPASRAGDVAPSHLISPPRPAGADRVRSSDWVSVPAPAARFGWVQSLVSLAGQLDCGDTLK